MCPGKVKELYDFEPGKIDILKTSQGKVTLFTFHKADMIISWEKHSDGGIFPAQYRVESPRK